MVTRRQWMAMAPAAALRPPDRAAAKVTVTGMEVFRVRINQRGNWVIPRLSTSAGVTGIGDASHGGADTPKLELLQRYFGLLKGRGIFDIERLRAELEPEIAKRGTIAAIAFSALEQALWDIRGKLMGISAAELFGGRLRDRVRCYANINRSTDTREPEGFARMAEQAVAAGFDAVKLAPFDELGRIKSAAERGPLVENGIACATAVRRAISDQRDLLIDAHSHFGLQDGLELARRLEPLKLYWLEEVTPPKDLPAINDAVPMTTAGGESIYGVKNFYRYIAAKSVDIAMPDVKYCGGMMELKKIAAVAEGACLGVAPHGPASPVGNIAAGHVCATMPNFNILEYSFGEVDWRAELVDPPERMEKGRLVLPPGPGLGISLNEKIARRYAVAG